MDENFGGLRESFWLAMGWLGVVLTTGAICRPGQSFWEGLAIHRHRLEIPVCFGNFELPSIIASPWEVPIWDAIVELARQTGFVWETRLNFILKNDQYLGCIGEWGLFLCSMSSILIEHADHLTI